MRIRRFSRLAVVLGVVLTMSVSGCFSLRAQSHTTKADEAAIAEFNRRYVQAINDGDIGALSSLTTEDHIMIGPNRPPLAGKAANIAVMTRAVERFRIDETWTPVETVVAGDLAYQRGSFTVAATPKAGGATSRTSGNFLRIYRRQPDGSWRMTRDMFNSDPPPTAGQQK